MAGDRVILLLALAVVAATGVSALWIPFGVDQALFVYAGQTAVAGEALYRDFWDIKPPGIFLFYGLVGWLFGFSEPAIHAAELLWQLLLALVLLQIARAAVVHRQAAALAPLAALATYYTNARSAHLTQVEALVGLPIAASLFFALRLTERPRRAVTGIYIGLAAGIVATMKPLYLVFPVAFCILSSARSRRADRTQQWRNLQLLGGSFTLGFSMIWLPLLTYFAFQGTLQEMLWTTFVLPREALLEVPIAPFERLSESIGWTARVFAPWLPLLLAGLWALRRPRRAMLSLGVVIYFLLAAVLILVQKISWWEYHFVLLFPPLGLLASLGLDRLLSLQATGTWARRAVLGTIGVLLLLPAVDLITTSATRLRQLHDASQMETDAPLANRLDPDYLQMWRKSRFLRDPSRNLHGTVYVFGDFRWVLLSQRRQAIAVHGHAWHHLPERFWKTLPEELMAAEPAYLFVGGFYRRLLRQRVPDLWLHIRQNYRAIASHRSGRWFQRHTPSSDRAGSAQTSADA